MHRSFVFLVIGISLAFAADANAGWRHGGRLFGRSCGSCGGSYSSCGTAASCSSCGQSSCRESSCTSCNSCGCGEGFRHEASYGSSEEYAPQSAPEAPQMNAQSDERYYSDRSDSSNSDYDKDRDSKKSERDSSPDSNKIDSSKSSNSDKCLP
jgi:hypothetical protein